MSTSTRFRSIIAAFAAVALLPAVAPSAAASVPTGTPAFTHPLVFTNEFFPFEPGAVKVHRGKDDGERIVVVEAFEATTRDFAWNGGTVATRLLREVEFEGGTLIEVSYNYFAEADDGTVYYFGEVVDIFEDGVIVEHGGSWLVGGPTLPSDPPDTATAADPAVFMPANPEVGDVFKPEDLPPVVDETVTVLSLDAKLKVEAGKFTKVLKVQEGSALPGSSGEKKWYARGVGVIQAKGKKELLELVATTYVPIEAP